MDEDQGIIDSFLDETGELLENIMTDVLELEENSSDEIVNRIYRAFHSVKGNSGMLGFSQLGAFAHKAEDMLSLIRGGKLEVNKVTADLLLYSLDTIKIILDDIQSGGDDSRDTTAAMHLMEDIVASATKPKEDTTPAPKGVEEPVTESVPVRTENKTAQPESHTDDLEASTDAALDALPEQGNVKEGFVLDLTTEPVESPVSPKMQRSVPMTGSGFIEGDGNREPAGEPLKILIVEDDFTSRTILTQFFSEYGECHIAKDGLEAIQAFTASYAHNPPRPYNLICMDIMMPRMDGTQAAMTIREIERGKGVEGTEYETSIIVVSAVNDPATIVKTCYECGANYYFAKPLDFKQMKQQMRKLKLIT